MEWYTPNLLHTTYINVNVYVLYTTLLLILDFHIPTGGAKLYRFTSSIGMHNIILLYTYSLLIIDDDENDDDDDIDYM